MIKNKGFTLIEILITVTIIAILSSIAIVSFGDSRAKKVLEITTNDIVFALEEQKSNAQAGKNGEDQGIKFNTNTYVFFGGEAYNSTDPDNIEKEIDNNYTFSTTATNDVIKFERITADVSNTATITISHKTESGLEKYIVVDTLGSVSVVE